MGDISGARIHEMVLITHDSTPADDGIEHVTIMDDAPFVESSRMHPWSVCRQM